MNNIIEIGDISNKGLEFDWNKEISWLQKQFSKDKITEFEFKEPLFSNFRITKSNWNIFIKGRFKTKINLYCSRCLEKVLYSINLTVDKVLVPYEHEEYKEEKELKQEDLEKDYYLQKIDLFEIIKEQILLNIPYKTQCKKDCKGLCVQCGINLNHNQCDCHINKAIDQRFAILKNLKL